MNHTQPSLQSASDEASHDLTCDELMQEEEDDEYTTTESVEHSDSDDDTDAYEAWLRSHMMQVEWEWPRARRFIFFADDADSDIVMSDDEYSLGLVMAA
jgi:hypothetical protein